MGLQRSGGGVKVWVSPLTCVVSLTTLSHYRASVWLVGYAIIICELFDVEEYRYLEIYK